MSLPNTAEAKRLALSEQIGSGLLYGTFGLLMFGPVAFGAVEPWSIFVLETGAILLALAWIAKQWIDGEVKISWNPLFLPMCAFGLLVLVQIVFRSSAYPHDTISHALLFIAYGILCFLSSQTLLRGVQARKLAVIFCIYGSVLAAFALIQGISSNGRLYWLRQPRLGGWIYGPYVNHNHYAGLMELLIPIPLVLSLTRLAPEKERIAAACAAAVIAGTIFLSGSRGGMLALVAELVVLAIVLVRQRYDWRTAAALGLFLVLVVALLTWLGGDELSRRFASVHGAHADISGDMRFQINRDGLHMFSKRPVLGWGLGCFPVAYPHFRTFYTNFFVNQAHDDYLQLLVEMGLLGFGVVVWYLVVLFRRAGRKIRNWSSEVGGAVTLASMLGIIGILVHSAVDFNLEIPANAALFYVFCTVAAAEPMVVPKRKRKPVQPPAEETVPASEVV
jgi:O-antigen ligase